MHCTGIASHVYPDTNLHILKPGTAVILRIPRVINGEPLVVNNEPVVTVVEVRGGCLEFIYWLVETGHIDVWVLPLGTAAEQIESVEGMIRDGMLPISRAGVRRGCPHYAFPPGSFAFVKQTAARHSEAIRQQFDDWDRVCSMPFTCCLAAFPYERGLNNASFVNHCDKWFKDKQEYRANITVLDDSGPLLQSGEHAVKTMRMTGRRGSVSGLWVDFACRSGTV